jgi:hypothetical protein
VEPLEVECVGAGLGAGAGVVGGGASVCVGAGVAGGAAPGVGVGVLPGVAAGTWNLGLRFLCARLLLELWFGLGLACGDGRTTGLAADVGWAFAERAKRVANATAVIALSWVARQVSRESRRRP